MKNYEIEEKVQPMIGRLFSYNKKEVRVLRYDLNETRLKIVTDIDDIVILRNDVDPVLLTFVPIEEKDYGNAIAVMKNQTMIGQSASEIKAILLENIKNVQRDKANVPQATAINNSVKQFIDLAKSEIEMFKLMAYASKK